MQSPIQNNPIVNLPSLYKYGLTLTRLTNKTLSVSSGTCRDSNNVIDIVLGNENVEGNITAAPLILNMQIVGANGIDEGEVDATTMYAIYMIADSRYYKPVACIATLDTNAKPKMPFGYDSYRLIGFWAMDASANFLVGRYSGISNDIKFFYDIQQVFLNSGTATSLTSASLGALVPAYPDVSVGVQAIFTGATAGQVNNWYNGTSSGSNYALIYCTVNGVVVSEQLDLSTGPVTVSSPNLNYAVAGGSVNGYVLNFAVSL